MIKEIKISDYQFLTNIDKDIHNFINNSPYRHIRMYEEDEVKGYIIYDIIDDRMEIINIYVDNNYRHQGIGTKLLNNIILLAKVNKFNNISLEVNVNNIEAICLYKKLGFTVEATRDNYYNGEDAYLMLKEIDKKSVYILAIESSCDETSVSIVKDGNVELATSTATQIDIHELYGGVVPEIASREHVKSITLVLEDALIKSGLKIDDISAIAVTIGPGLVGSLLVGIEAAKTLALIYNKPLIPVNHMKGHIFGNYLHNNVEYPALCLIISGGHTELVYLTDPYNFKKIGETVDDAVGECYDKVARVLNLTYPGGPKIDALAHKGRPSYKLPMPLKDDSLNFSYSGLKSAVINLVNSEKQRGNEIVPEDLARSFQDIIVSSLIYKTEKALDIVDVKTIMLAGGVSANSDIRLSFENLARDRKLNFSCPLLKYCTDNAAMIASYAYFLYLNKEFSDLKINAKPSLDIF